MCRDQGRQESQNTSPGITPYALHLSVFLTRCMDFLRNLVKQRNPACDLVDGLTSIPQGVSQIFLSVSLRIDEISCILIPAKGVSIHTSTNIRQNWTEDAVCTVSERQLSGFLYWKVVGLRTISPAWYSDKKCFLTTTMWRLEDILKWWHHW